MGHFFCVNATFFMGLFFMISGYFFAPSFDKKGFTKFTIDKLIRYGIPLVFVYWITFILTMNFIAIILRSRYLHTLRKFTSVLASSPNGSLQYLPGLHQISALGIFGLLKTYWCMLCFIPFCT